MRILAVTPRIIYPPLSGGESRVFSLLTRLARSHELSLATFVEPGEEAQAAAAALRLESGPLKKVHLVARTGACASRPGLPRAARRYFDEAMARALDRLSAEGNFDLVHLEFSEMGQYAPYVRTRAATVLTEHDASFLSLSRSYLRREGGAWEQLKDWIRRLRYSREIAGQADEIVAVSPADARRLRWLAGCRATLVPTGVDLERFDFHGQDRRQRDLAMFLGHYPHYPNEDAALWLCREIWPLVREKRPGARLALVGSKPTAAVQALRGPDVEISGTLPDVRPYLHRAGLFIAPLRLGFGIKGKLLEAFACGAPVLATPVACEALPGIEPGRHLLVGKTARELARLAISLLDDPALAATLAREARRYVEARFGWDTQADALERVYRQALAGYAARASTGSS
ncbi:MAG: glycosyltransferase [Elusimicrobia bacterium]|nr:glycosyltransferase [Elusimicrobiota bacterium]